MHDIVRILAGTAAILAVSFSVMALLIRLVSRVNPDSSSSPWLWHPAMFLARLFAPLLPGLGIARPNRAARTPDGLQRHPYAASHFRTVRRAKDYLADQIVREAAHQGMAFSDIEHKMLYYSETGWTLPEMAQVAATFRRDYDQRAYEQKIFVLLCKIRAHRLTDLRERERWDEAIHKMDEGGHYLQVLLNPGQTRSARAPSEPHVQLKLWFAASAVVVALCTTVALCNWLLGPRFWSDLDGLLHRLHGM